MGKQGPCYHCGVTSTPLWRNGPPEKPILCNACGSRWRTKGSLANYTPLHARAEHDDFEIFKIPKVKKISIKRKEGKLLKRKQSLGNVEVEGEGPDPDRYFSKFLDEDTNNRSSSGSAVSYSESCAQFSGNDASDLTGSAQSIMGDTLVPSRKRTCMNHPKPSHVEKLTRDLHSILHEQQSSSSYFSGSSEEDLLFESGTPMVSVEIGHGSILIRHPNMVAREEESEASSLSVDNKPCPINEAYSGDASLPVHIDNWGVSFQSTGPEKVTMPMGHGTYEEQTKRDKLQHDELQILRNHNSPLGSVDLKEIICFEEFVEHMTHEEQLKLMKYLPSIDATLPDSLRSMFDSLQFAENISSFQKLLAEGVFDFSVSGISSEECKALKRLALVNLTKSKWVENYNLLKEVKHKHIKGGKGIESGSRFPWSNNLVPVKRPRDIQNQNLPEPKAMMKSPKRFLMKANYDVKDLIDNDASCFSLKSLFSLPPDGNSLMLDPFPFTHDNSDQDLLFDVPSNGSFPEAELLNFSSSIGTQQASTSSSTVYPHLVHL